MTAHAYRLTGKAGWSANGQQALVHERFAQGPCTIKEVVAFLDSHPKFSTVQSSERIAAYYICVLKKAGYLEKVSPEPVVEYNPDLDPEVQERLAETE